MTAEGYSQVLRAAARREHRLQLRQRRDDFGIRASIGIVADHCISGAVCQTAFGQRRLALLRILVDERRHHGCRRDHRSTDGDRRPRIGEDGFQRRLEGDDHHAELDELENQRVGPALESTMAVQNQFYACHDTEVLVVLGKSKGKGA